MRSKGEVSRRTGGGEGEDEERSKGEVSRRRGLKEEWGGGAGGRQKGDWSEVMAPGISSPCRLFVSHPVLFSKTSSCPTGNRFMFCL